MPAHQGFHVLADHLGPGVMQPLNVVITGAIRGDGGQGDASADTAGGTVGDGGRRDEPHVARRA